MKIYPLVIRFEPSVLKNMYIVKRKKKLLGGWSEIARVYINKKYKSFYIHATSEIPVGELNYVKFRCRMLLGIRNIRSRLTVYEN